MKKLWVTVIIIFIVCFSVFAEVDKPRLLFGTGNDKFTYGISKNDDDQLSYSGIIEFDFEKYRIKLDMNAFTDRGSYYDGDFRNGRLDAMLFSTLVENKIKINDYLDFKFNRTFGLGMTGKFHFDFVQNLHHRNVGVEPVNIPYDWDMIKVAPIIGLDAGLGLHIYDFDASLMASYENILFFTSSLKASLDLSLFNAFDFQVGYKHGTNDSSSLTMESVVKSQNGPFINLSIGSSPITLSWQFYPSSRFGYGSFLFDVMPLYSSSDWKSSELYLDLSKSQLYGMELLNAYARVPFNDKFQYVFGVSYVSGFPENTVSDNNNRIQRNYGLYEAGIYYSPVQWYVSPYFQAQIGFGAFQLTYLNNTKQDRSDDVALPTKITLSSDVRVGLEMIPEGFVSFGNTSYEVQVFAGMHMFPWYKKLGDLLKLDNCHPADWKPSFCSPYWGIGVSVGIDIPEINGF